MERVWNVKSGMCRVENAEWRIECVQYNKECRVKGGSEVRCGEQEGRGRGR